MKKKLLAAILAVASIASIGALAACENGESGHTHSYDDGVTQTAATCYSEGEILYTCSGCGNTYTESIQKIPHSWGEWTVAEGDEPTAEEDGEGKATRKCTVEQCGEEDEPLTIPNLSEGEFTTKVIEAKSCTKDGITEYTYTHGEDTVKFNITVPMSHNYQTEITWVGGFPNIAEITCSDCDDVNVELVRQYVPKDENDKQPGSITEVYEQQLANCQQPGYSRRTAIVEYKGEIIKTELKVISETPITDHQYVLNEKVKYGYDETNHWHVCFTNGCGNKEEGSEEAHDYSNSKGVIVKRATATEQGERELECVCGHKKIVKFDGATDSCDITAPYYSVTDFNGAETSQIPLGKVEDKYYYLADGESVLFGFNNLSNGESAVNGVELFYEKNGSYVPVIDVTDRADGDEHPVAGGFIGDSTSANFGKCAIRFYKVGGVLQIVGGVQKYVGGSYAEITLKVVVYVGEESIGVEKIITLAPVPELEKPQAYNYTEYVTQDGGQTPYFDYKWADLSDTVLYVGQSYKLKAHGYNVSVSKDGGAAEELTEESNVFTFEPQTAGEYVITVANTYNSKESYTVTITVNGAVDTSTLFSGKYAADGYTVTFGESNAVTVQKGEEQAVNLTYTYEEGVFATAGSQTLSIILTPAYKLYIVDSGNYLKLQEKGEPADETFYEMLGGTSWTKFVETSSSNRDFTFTIVFNADGTGSITNNARNRKKYTETTFKFTYTGEKIRDYIKLTFELVEDDEAYAENTYGAYEFGVETDEDLPEGRTYKNFTDFSIMNKDSKVTVENEEVSLSLWLKTGDYNEMSSTEQAVEFDLVTE